MLDFK